MKNPEIPEELLERIASAWCIPPNENKIMDPNLAHTIALQVLPLLAPLPEAATPKPVCYVLMAADGRMFWHDEECVYDEPSHAGAQLEYLQQDEPDDGWHIAPLYALKQSSPQPQPTNEGG